MVEVVKVVVTGARGPQSTVPGPTGMIEDASGFIGAIAIPLSGRKPHTVRTTDAQNISTVDVADTYAGTGTGTKGAGRFFFGTLTPSNDDSTICSGREVAGLQLFSHGFRVEDTFLSTNDSAYTAYDAAQTYLGTSSVKYNHGYAFQSRPLMAAGNGMDLFSSFVSFPRVSAGTVDRLYHFHIQGLAKTGGTIGQHVGLYISPLSGGQGGNYAIYQESGTNPNYFAGDTQFGGAVTGIAGLAISGELKAARAVHAYGTIDSFNPAGGLVLAGQGGAALYRTLRSYADSSGSPAGLSIVSSNVLIGGTVPVTGAALEIFGNTTPSSDNTFNLGSATYRFNTVYAGTGTINTSDERLKREISALPDEWLDAWGKVEWSRFKFEGGSRWHVGLIAQRVHQAFADAGLDAFAIGLCCYDEWDDVTRPIYAEVEKTRKVERSVAVPIERTVSDRVRSGRSGWRTVKRKFSESRIEIQTVDEVFTEMEDTGETELVTPAGDRWGLRYDECQALEAAYQRREIANLRSQLAALQAA